MRLLRLQTARNPSLSFKKGKSQGASYFTHFRTGSLKMTGPLLGKKTSTFYLLVSNSCLLPQQLKFIDSPVDSLSLTSYSPRKAERRKLSSLWYVDRQAGREAAIALPRPPCSVVSFKVINLLFFSQPQRGYRGLGMNDIGV